MAIKYAQPKAAEYYAKAGEIIGTAQKKLREQEIAASLQTQKAAHEWEIEKMQLRSQLDFQQELRDRQHEYDRINAAREWDLEKMRIASQLDFEEEERERQQRRATFISGRDKIIEDKTHTDEWKDRAFFELSSRFTDVPEAGQYLGYTEPKEEKPVAVPWHVEYSKNKYRGTEEYNRAQEYLQRAAEPAPTYADIQKEMEARDIVMARIPSFSDSDLADLGLTREGITSTPDFNPPVRVETEEEFLALPIGTKVMFPDGTIVTR